MPERVLPSRLLTNRYSPVPLHLSQMVAFMRTHLPARASRQIAWHATAWRPHGIALLRARRRPPRQSAAVVATSIRRTARRRALPAKWRPAVAPARPG